MSEPSSLVASTVGDGVTTRTEVPLNERRAFNLSVHYTFHFYRPEEYNGWNLTYALRYRF